MPASGVKEENFPLLIPALENARYFYRPYESGIISTSIRCDLPETTLELFFSGISCKICSGHTGVPVEETQVIPHQASPGPARVILFIFHFMISWIMQNTKMSSVFWGLFPRMFLVQVVVWGLETPFFSLLSRLYFVIDSVRVSFGTVTTNILPISQLTF